MEAGMAELESSRIQPAETALHGLRTLQIKVRAQPSLLATLPIDTQVKLHALARFDEFREDVLSNKLHSTGIQVEARGCDEDLAFFGSAGPEIGMAQPKTFPLLPELVRQINSVEGATSAQSSFVVLGDSGTGKSTLAMNLCQTFWNHIDEYDRIPVYIFLPEYKTVRQLLKHFFGNRLNDTGLDEAKRLRFLLVLDSFDELPDGEKESNIATAQLPDDEGNGVHDPTNYGWQGVAGQFRDVKIVILSRKQGLDPDKRRKLFDFQKTRNSLSAANEGHTVLYMAPFTPEDVRSYVQKFAAALRDTSVNLGDNSILQMVKKHTEGRAWENDLDVDGPARNSFLRWFETLPDLFQLASTPLLLSLILAVMPEMLNPLDDSPRPGAGAEDYVAKLNELRKLCRSRTGIYDLFTGNWFRFQSERLEYSNSHPDLVQGVTREERLLLFRLYSQNLAHWFLHAGSFKNALPLSETEHCTLMDAYQGNQQLKEACDRITIASLGASNADTEENGERDRFGSISLPASVRDRDVFPNADTEMDDPSVRNRKLRNLRAIRDGCLLQFSPSGCKFIHRSLVVYFESRQLSETIELLFQLYMRNELAAIDEHTADLLLTNQLTNTDILSELATRVTLRDRFDEVLLDVVRATRRLPSLATFASNAITILNLGGHSFSGMDLSRVVIPGANLNNAILACTDLRGANLEGAFLESALLSQAQLQGANLRHVEFGQAPSHTNSRMINGLSEEMEVSSFYSVAEGKEYWIVGSTKMFNMVQATGVEPCAVTKYERDWTPAVPNFHSGCGHQGETENRANIRTRIGTTHVLVTYEKSQSRTWWLEAWSIEDPSSPPVCKEVMEGFGSTSRVAEDKGYVAVLDVDKLTLFRLKSLGESGLDPVGSTEVASTSTSSSKLDKFFSGIKIGGVHEAFDFRCAHDASSCIAIVCTAAELNSSKCIVGIYKFDHSESGDCGIVSPHSGTKTFSAKISCVQIWTASSPSPLPCLVAIAQDNQQHGSNLELWSCIDEENSEELKLQQELALAGHPEPVLVLACTSDMLVSPHECMLASVCKAVLILWQLSTSDPEGVPQGARVRATKIRVIQHNPVSQLPMFILKNNSYGENCLAFSADSEYLALINRSDEKLKVWKLRSRVAKNVTEPAARARARASPAKIEEVAIWKGQHQKPDGQNYQDSALMAVIYETRKNSGSNNYTNTTSRLRVLDLESGKEVTDLGLRGNNYLAVEFLTRNTLLLVYTDQAKECGFFLELIRLDSAPDCQNDEATVVRLQVPDYDWFELNPYASIHTDVRGLRETAPARAARVGAVAVGPGASEAKGILVMALDQSSSRYWYPPSLVWTYKVTAEPSSSRLLLQVDADGLYQELSIFPEKTTNFDFALHGTWLAFSVDTHGGLWDLSQPRNPHEIRVESMGRKHVELQEGVSRSQEGVSTSTLLYTWDPHQIQGQTLDSRTRQLGEPDFSITTPHEGGNVPAVMGAILPDSGHGSTSGPLSLQAIILEGVRVVWVVSQRDQERQTLLTIPLWFNIFTSRFVPNTGTDRGPRKNMKAAPNAKHMGTLVLGASELETLCAITLTLSLNSDCTEQESFLNPGSWAWKLLWCKSKCTDLIADSAKLTKAHFGDELSLSLLRQEGALGVEDVLRDDGHGWRFNSYACLFTEIPGTDLGDVACGETILRVGNPPRSLLIDESLWAVFAVAELREGFWGRVLGHVKPHVFLVIEGVLNNRRFLIYADYVVMVEAVAGVRIFPWCEANSDSANVGEAWTKFKDLSDQSERGRWQAQEFPVTTRQGLALIDAIYEDRQARFVYGLLANETSETMSCTKWVHDKLASIGCTLTKRWVNRICYPTSQLVYTYGRDRNPFVRATILLKNLSPQQVWYGLMSIAVIMPIFAVIVSIYW